MFCPHPLMISQKFSKVSEGSRLINGNRDKFTNKAPDMAYLLWSDVLFLRYAPV